MFTLPRLPLPAYLPLGVCLALGHTLPGAAAQTPVISEFVALNSNGLRDEDGDESDWIELHLPATASALDLGGWSLTDDAQNLAAFASCSPRTKIAATLRGHCTRTSA